MTDPSKLLYPKKGTFTKKDLVGKTHVKKNFNGEHMWVAIDSIQDIGIFGTVDNVPEWEGSPEYGQNVFVLWSEIEDVYPKKKGRRKSD